MSKSLLFVGGSAEAVPAIMTAQNMGIYIVVSDMNPEAEGVKVADDFFIASTYDSDNTMEEALRYHKEKRKIDGVICVASDVPVSVAEVAKKLKLPGISIESANNATNKMLMKNIFNADNIDIPWYSEVNSTEHLKEIVKEHGYPLVVKPVDSRGARGVLKLTNRVDLDWAFKLAQSNSPTEKVMVEQFLAGPQVSTESIILNGKAYTPGFSDRNYELLETYAPFIVENGGELPTILSDSSKLEVNSLIEKAAKSMDIDNWVVKGDIVIYQGKPYIIELAARLSGGYFCTHEIPLSTGVDFVKQAIKLAIGEKVEPTDLKPLYQKGVGQRYLFPKPGMVIKICGVEEVKKWPEVALCEVRVKVGDLVKPIENHPGRAGVVITTAETKEEAVRIAEEAVKTIKIETE